MRFDIEMRDIHAIITLYKSSIMPIKIKEGLIDYFIDG